MYKSNRQISIDDFIFPYGTLNVENDWVKLATILPWDTIEEKYAEKFVNNGHPAHPARMALGSLLIKQRLQCSDEWVLRHISENPYMQFFIGLSEYVSVCPFGESTMVSFRKRFDEQTLVEINEMLAVDQSKGNNDEDQNDDVSNGGTLILDATCAPADVRYPQDLSLLNECREKTEKLLDELHEQVGGVKPRSYRQKARKDFLKASKMRKKSGAVIRKAIRKQLNYLKRNMKNIGILQENGAVFNEKQEVLYSTICLVYEQQYYMFSNHTNKVSDRIVSLSQPWVRPIVRNKAKAKTEFGAKLHLSLTDGFARVELLSFDAFNESEDFISAIERYRSRTGRYPTRVLADKLYRNRKNLVFCNEREIQMTGPRLGRPPKNYAPDKKQEYVDLCQRNTIEGAFGTAKTAYGLSRIAARLENTSRTVICLAVLWLNLGKRLKALLRLLLQFLYQAVPSLQFLAFGF